MFPDANHAMAGPSHLPLRIIAAPRRRPPLNAYPWPRKPDTVIGNDVWIGMDALVMPGIRIGHGAVNRRPQRRHPAIVPTTPSSRHPPATCGCATPRRTSPACWRSPGGTGPPSASARAVRMLVERRPGARGLRRALSRTGTPGPAPSRYSTQSCVPTRFAASWPAQLRRGVQTGRSRTSARSSHGSG
jgi:hypothetical protein